MIERYNDLVQRAIELTEHQKQGVEEILCRFTNNELEYNKFVVALVSKLTYLKHETNLILKIFSFAIENNFYSELYETMELRNFNLTELNILVTTMNNSLFEAKKNLDLHFKDLSNDILVQISTIYLKFGIKYFEVNARHECFECFSSMCNIVTFMKIFPEKSLMISYYSILSQMFIEGNMFNSFINSFGRLILISPKILTKIKKEEFEIFIEKILKILEIKNEENIFRSFFNNLPIITISRFRKILEENLEIEEVNLEIESSSTLISKVFDFGLNSYWDLILESNDAIKFENDLNLLAFLTLNNLKYTINGGYIRIQGYKYESVVNKSFIIKNEYEVEMLKTARDLKKDIRTKEYVKLEMKKNTFLRQTKVSKPIITKKIVHKDYFTRSYNICRLYMRENMEMSIKESSQDFFRRKRNYQSEYEKYKKNYEFIKNEYDEIKETAFEAKKKLEIKIISAYNEKLKKEEELREIERNNKLENDKWTRKKIEPLASKRSFYGGDEKYYDVGKIGGFGQNICSRVNLTESKKDWTRKVDTSKDEIKEKVKDLKVTEGSEKSTENGFYKIPDF